MCLHISHDIHVKTDQTVSTLWNSLPISVNPVENITTFSHKLKHAGLNLLIQRTNPTVYHWNCLIIDYELLNPFCFGALPRAWVSRGF